MTISTDVRRRRTSPAAWILIAPIRFYQKFITPYTPATCRYYPTCSEYAVRSLHTHGALKGFLLTAWRLLRCNPWSSGGVDHTPERGHWRGGRDAAPDGSRSPGVRHDEDDVIPADGRPQISGDTDGIATDSARPGGGAPIAGRAAA